MLKAAVLGGGAREAASYARGQLAGDEAAPTPPAAYALAIAALVEGDDDAAVGYAAAMRAGSEPFGRAADAIAALAAGDRVAYRAAIEAIVADFAAREEHLTGVRIADTAAMLEVLAAQRGLAAEPGGPLLAPAPV